MSWGRAAAQPVAQASASDQKLQALLAAMGRIVLDKPRVLRLSLACLLAGGHLLLEDLPGMGKTTLAEGWARLLGLEHRRVQFTSDLLPADILGLSVFNPAEQRFDYRPGPVFTQLLLADEINRSSPRTQSALLEAMEEGQVSQDGVTRALPQPFFVIATQNPLQQSGVYPLPESQLDRFLMCLSLGHPSPAAERDLLMGVDRRQLLAQLQPLADAAQLLHWRQQVHEVHVADPVLDYVQALTAQSRRLPGVVGLSTRAVLALKRATQAHALIEGRGYAVAADVQAVFVAVAGHRLGGGTGVWAASAAADGAAHEGSWAQQILAKTPVTG